MEKIIKENKNIIALVVVALIIGGSILGAQKMKQDSIEKQISEKETEKVMARIRYNSCESDAFDVYTNQWNAHCESIGREDNCMLPSDAAKQYEKLLEDDEKICLELYKLEIK